MRLIDLGAIVFACLTAAGCAPCGTRMPVYELPPRPVLDTSAPDTVNEQALRRYGAALEVILHQHNAFAAQNNKKVTP
jgi:hypothetical protein